MKRATGRIGFLLVLYAAFLPAGCTRDGGEEAAPGPRVEEMTVGPVTVTITAEPGKVRVDSDVLMTIRIACPSEIEIAQPELDDRVQGFNLTGFFAVEPTRSGGRVAYEYRARLTPRVAEEYRLAPMPLRYTDRSASPATIGWLATGPVVFEVETMDSGSGVQTDVEPVWIRPSFVTVMWWVVGVIVLIGLLYVLWCLARRVKHTVELRRMSPRERAMRELDRLLAKDLLNQRKVKEFYIELTMIVRRYIERRHGIRAPEQTTEEFLVAVQDDARFGEYVVSRLRDFLQAADLVKFAAHCPDGEAVRGATETAKDYIRTDDAAADDADPGSVAPSSDSEG